uniref:Bm14461 n=1 Tax=Brugia malayi TaxID=6279 RepID=A0A1I9G1Z8_BRUMA|nr:Bm14461 [Brugia malayi]
MDFKFWLERVNDGVLPGDRHMLALGTVTFVVPRI